MTARTPTPSLTSRTTRGVAWLLAQTLGSKVANLLGLIALSWILKTEDFGLIALTYLASVVAAIFSPVAVREVLVHRHNRMGKWANAAFWMSLTFGLIGTLAMVALAPLLAWCLDEPRLKGLVWLMAVPLLFDRLGTVPLARLHAQMRFRTVAVLGLSASLCTTALTVLFAWCEFGAYSFVWSRLLVAVLVTAALWGVAGIKLSWSPQLRRWVYLISDTGLIFCATLLYMAISQGDYLVIALFVSNQDHVGLYYFAFTLSSQTAAIVLSNLSQVLFPALRTIVEPQRRMNAFLRAARLSALLAVPLCLLQAALAEPVFHAVLHEKWIPAIPMLQILSVGMISRLIGLQGNSLIKAQGRFGSYLALTAAYTITFFILVTAGAWQWGTLGVAIGAAVQFTLVGVVNLYAAIRPDGGSWRDVGAVYLPPLAAGGASVGAACAAAEWISSVAAEPWVAWLQIGTILLVTAAICVPLSRWLAPLPSRDLTARVREMIQNLTGWFTVVGDEASPPGPYDS